MRLIPTNTKLPADKIPIVERAIARRQKALDKLKYGQIEATLWLMEEIEHLKELLRFNQSSVGLDIK